MTEDEDPDLELYGVSPGVIAFFMIFITLVVPLGILPANAFVVFFGPELMGFGSSYMIYSVTWMFAPELFYFPIAFLPFFFLFNIWFTLPLTIFNIAYIWKIIRYYRGKCTRYSVIWVGLLSITVPTVLTIVWTGYASGGGVFGILGPIPIQFIVGLIFLYKIPGPEMTSPWRYDLSERSWWVKKRPDWWYRMFPSEEKETKSESESVVNDR